MRTSRIALAAALLALVPTTLALTGRATPAAADTAAPSGTFTLLNYNVAGLPVVHEPPTTLSMEDAATQIGLRLPP